MKNHIKKRSKLLKPLLTLVLLLFEGYSSTAQVQLIDEKLIHNRGLYFDGVKVTPAQSATYADQPNYDYVFGRRITPHGDCIETLNEYVFMTWYQGGEFNRHVMLSRYNTITKKLVTIQFPHTHTGYLNNPRLGESHNTIGIGVAPVDGTIHLLYDMHAFGQNRPADGSLSNDYFRYSYSKKNVATLPDSEFTLDNFFAKRLYLKNGDNYEGLTYPKFFKNKAGELFVSMREGGNNNGKYMTAKYNGTSWSSFKDFNILNAKNKGLNYNWGLYGEFKFLNDKMHVGFAIRKSINTDKFTYNSGFYYAYAENSNNISNWKDHNGQSVATPLIDPEGIFISEPGNEVGSSGANSVNMTTGADWTITADGSIHFRIRVAGTETKNVHTYKKAGTNTFITSTDFPGGDFHTIGNDVYLIGIESGKPVIYKAPGGTNDWEEIYRATSSKSFRHGSVHISQGKLYYYLMETGSGSAQPLYLQIIDLGITSNTAPTVSFVNPSTDNQEFNLGETITLKVDASDDEGDIEKVNFKINGGFYKLVGDPPFQTDWTPTTAGTYTIGARAFEAEQDGLDTEISKTVIIKENVLSVVDLDTPLSNGKVYPNPIQNNKLFIQGMPVKPGILKVVDLGGKVLLEKNITTKNEQLDVTNLQKGIYILRIKAHKSNTSVLFVKQ